MTLAQSVRRFANQLQALHLWIAGTLLIIFAGLFSFTAQRTFLAYQEEIQHDLTSSVSEVRSRLDDIIEYLGFLGAEVLQKNLSEAILNQRAKTLGLHHKELSAIGWIKPHGQITWSFLKDSHEIESSLKKPELIQTLRKAQENQSPIMSPVFRMLNRSKNFAIFVPLQLENHYNGVFFCFISLDEMINSIFPSWLLSRYDISIIDSKNRVLARELVSLNPKLNLTAQSEAISPNLDLRIRLQRYQQIWDWESVLLMALSLGVVMGVAMAVKDLNTDRRQKRELAVQMRYAKDLAEAANRTKTEFVANVSHELRTPLTAIIGNSDLMLRELPYPSCLEHRLQTIAKNSQHLLLLINDLLDHSKIEAGFLDINKKPISILDFMREILIVCQPLAEAKQLKLKIGTMGPIPSIITSDRLRLKQILTNLIGNAIKFTEQGSITIRFHSFQDQKDGKIQLECRVDDTGIGIDPLQQDKIFEAFAQANPKITARFGGTGLGLAISRQLAQRLGGDVILLKSELKKGSSFACRLPIENSLSNDGLAMLDIDDIGEPFISAAIPQIPRVLEQKCILLVEDSCDNEQLIRSYLERSGAQVVWADTGEAAIQRITAGEFYDAILMDIQLPGIDGYTSSRILRQKNYKNPIIVLTAQIAPQEDERCRLAGCQAYLPKPFDPQILIETLYEYLVSHSKLPPRPRRSKLLADAELQVVVTKFVEQLPKRLSDIEQAQHDENWVNLARIAHKLKGTAANFDYPDLAAEASRLEEHSLKGDEQQKIEQSYLRLKIIVEQMLHSFDA